METRPGGTRRTIRRDPLENEIEAAFVLRVEEELGGRAFKLRPPPAGLPDRLVLLPGAQICFAEFKKLDGRDRLVQPLMHAILRRLGFKVFRLEGRAEMENWVATVKARQKPR